MQTFLKSSSKDLGDDFDDYEGNYNPLYSNSTALMVASKRDHDGVVGLLLRHGADVNKANPLGHTPLMMASLYGRATCLTLLLHHDVDINLRDGQCGVVQYIWHALTDMLSVSRCSSLVEPTSTQL